MPHSQEDKRTVERKLRAARLFHQQLVREIGDKPVRLERIEREIFLLAMELGEMVDEEIRA